MAEIIPPAPPVWDAASFAANFQALLPTGPVWPRDLDAVQSQAMAALVPTYVRNTDAASNLIADAFPSTAEDMLPDWESVLGLPDPCAGPDPTIAQRQAHVVARLTQQDGPSIPSLTAFAATLGFVITITEFAPARADISGADDPVYEPAWAFVWQVNVSSITVEYACADTAFADDPLLTIGNTVLQCELQRLAPAHTILQFNYEG